MKLNVYFGRSLVGQINQSWRFHYTEEWLERPTAFGISLSLPLQKETLPQKECRNFFANLLPEATLRENICKAHQIDYEDDFALLKLVGGECAGALQIVSEEAKPSIGKGWYEEVSLDALCDRLKARPSLPLAEYAADLRMSLAGAQDKLPVLYRDGLFFLPRDGEASSHILKPTSARFPDSVTNEAFSMELAKRLGFVVPKISIIPSSPSLFLIDRYDRKFRPDGTVERLHQEDFCQALGIAHQKKYEFDGGPGFAKCAAVLEKTNSPGLNRLRLARWGIFNVLIGNADAHGKNLSLLYGGESSVPDMAPSYDLLCTAVYPELSTKMAMHIGGERFLNRIYGTQWERYSKDVDLRKGRIFTEIEMMSDQIVGEAERLAHEMEEEYGTSEFYAKAIAVIAKNCATTKKAALDSKSKQVANQLVIPEEEEPPKRGAKI